MDKKTYRVDPGNGHAVREFLAESEEAAAELYCRASCMDELPEGTVITELGVKKDK